MENNTEDDTEDEDKNNNITFSPHTPDYPPPDCNMEKCNDEESCDKEDNDKECCDKNEKPYNFRNNRKQENPFKNENEEIDKFFSKLLNTPLQNPRDSRGSQDGLRNRRKKRTFDDFSDYFKESDILLPINKSIKTLADLIELGKSYDPCDTNRYVINLRALNKCVEPLEELNNMIGMKNIKEMIIDLIFSVYKI